MPNWCENDLRIIGQKAKIEEFLATIRGESVIDFNTIIPYPEKYKEMDEMASKWKPNLDNPQPRPKDGFNSGGYKWCIENWGTKWNASRITLDEMDQWESDAEITVHFDTAWSPPVPVIYAASKKFPDLRFELRYFEQGCAFNGLYVVQNCKIEYDEAGKYFGNRGG